jgi:putative effector of murein hydrolase
VFTFFGVKSHAVGMLTKIRISKARGVLAELGIACQALAKFITIIKLGNFGNLALSSVW